VGVSALLSAHRLSETHGVLSQASGRLGDPTAEDLRSELEPRLSWGGMGPESSTPVRPDSQEAERQTEVLETANVELLRSDWTGRISAGVAWLVFLQVEGRLSPFRPDPEG
jgi:hypothetical protein